MAFQRVYDMEQADKLWEAGLLWSKWSDSSTWYPDRSREVKHSPSIYGFTDPSGSTHLQYAILLEE